MSAMGGWDWVIVIAYLAAAVVIGAWSARRASESTEGFFVAGRSLPWWVAGTSMVATTFAADTPLWVCGVVATHGIAGNWFWWGMALAHVLAAVYLARLWRRSEAMTDAGIIETRYSGNSAAALRAFKAFFFAVPINCITMGWVILAMQKIMGVFIEWRQILGTGLYRDLQRLWPEGFAFDLDTGLSVFVAMTIAVVYSVLGGLRGVIITDMVQFVLAMVGALAVAILGVRHVGGLDALVEKLQVATGDAEGILAMVPGTGSEWMPLHLFGVYLMVLWWAQKYSDAGGYLMQRMAACKDDRHAAGATLWFTVAHYVVRTWPWVLAGLVAVVLWPPADSPHVDREAAYPMLMLELLPEGLLGITVASLVAAFMSTIDTHVNWGASYLVTDLYRRFFKKNASEAHYVRASRWGVVVMALIAGFIATQMTSIDAAWKFFSALGSGLGLVALARWVWWRVNAWSELSALIATCVITVVLTLIDAGGYTEALREAKWWFPLTLLVTMGGSTIVWVIVTFLTDPVDDEVLDAFYRKVRPVGAWGPVRARCGDAPPTERGREVLVAWLTGAAFVYGLLFGIGHLLVGTRPLGVALCLVGAVCGWLTWRLMIGRGFPGAGARA